jgi:chlorobactene glucosyltransferase
VSPLIAALIAGGAVWLLFVAHRRWQQLAWPPVAPLTTLPTVSVVIPARNEAATIARSVQSLLAQQYPPDLLDIIVIDDHSTDATTSIVGRIAKHDPRVQVITSAPLPRGWTGKSHACWQGANAATGEWLLFVDADTVASPTLITHAVALADNNTIDCLSLYPRQELGGFWERVIMPITILAFLIGNDLRHTRDPRSIAAVAIGQCILVRRAAYLAIHGHAAVRSAMLEDIALARLFKRHHLHCDLRSGDRLIATRMYTSLGAIWQGITKNAVDGAGSVGQALLAGAAIIALALFPLSPIAVMPNTANVIPASIAIGVGLLSYAIMLRRLHVPMWYAITLPLGLFACGLLLIDSGRRRATGRSVWKDRVFAPDDARE